jgi:hypothetical protein
MSYDETLEAERDPWDHDSRGDTNTGERVRCPSCLRRVREWEVVEAIGMCERCAERKDPPRAIRYRPGT